MPTNQECFFQASLIIELAIADLRGSVELGTSLRDFEVVEVCNRLEFAGQIIRRTNGGGG